MVDAKWLDILKAGGWKAAAGALALGAFAVLLKVGAIPDGGLAWLYPVSVLLFLLFTFVCLASIASYLSDALQLGRRIRSRRARRAEQQEVRSYIPYMTDRDRTIIGYLLHHRQKMFTYEPTGGHAASLISRGIIRMAAQPGQVFSLMGAPFVVPDHVWEVLEEHSNQFPYIPPQDGEREKHPWAIGWMAR